MKLKDNENIAVLGIFLGAVGLLSALVLALVSHVTASPIAAAQAAQQKKAMGMVLPAFDNDPSGLVYEAKTSSGWNVKFMGAKKSGKLVAVAAVASNPGGYGGKIEMLMGIAPDGKILADAGGVPGVLTCEIDPGARFMRAASYGEPDRIGDYREVLLVSRDHVDR